MRIWAKFKNLFAPSLKARKVLFVLFVISLVMDVDMLISPSLIRHGMLVPHAWGAGTHVLVAITEIALMVGATVLWFWMFYICLRRGSGVVRRLLWALAFFLGIWFTAQFYYFFRYRRFAADRQVT